MRFEEVFLSISTFLIFLRCKLSNGCSDTCSDAYAYTGRLFLIDLKSSHGSLCDKKPVTAHKPTHLRHHSRIQFATSQEDKTKAIFTVKLENAQGQGEKRRNPDDKSMTTVRASHLLVKHKDSRRPSSWKVSFNDRYGEIFIIMR